MCVRTFSPAGLWVWPGYTITSNGTASDCILAISEVEFSNTTLSSLMPWMISKGSLIRATSASALERS